MPSSPCSLFEMLKFEMDSSRASHLLLAYCNSLQGFHSHHWRCENSALGLIHSHGKGCRRRRRHPRLPLRLSVLQLKWEQTSSDIYLRHSVLPQVLLKGGKEEYVFILLVFCPAIFCRIGERYCVAMLTHELLTAAASPGPSHYRLAMEKEPANHPANSNTASTSPLQLPAIQKRLTNTHTSFTSTDYMHAHMHLLTCIWDRIDM